MLVVFPLNYILNYFGLTFTHTGGAILSYGDYLIVSLIYLWALLPFFVIVAILITARSLSRAMKIWKWILTLTILLELSVVVIAYLPVEPGAGFAVGFVLVAVLFFAELLRFVGVIGFLIAEWVARRRVIATDTASNSASL